MATPVVCGWVGAVLELPEHLGKRSETKNLKNRPTNAQMTNHVVESCCTRLKRNRKGENISLHKPALKAITPKCHLKLPWQMAAVIGPGKAHIRS